MIPDPNPTPPPPDTSGLPREAYALLAQANLCRMRGQWEQAVERCMQVMTLAPDNASAQSLLGDIYDNQGFQDDAIQWYRMALDVQPSSPADRLKLSRLLEAKARRLPPPPPAAVPEAAPPPPAAPLAAGLRRWQERLGDKSDALVKWAALGAGLLVVCVVVVALAQIRAASRIPVHEVSAPPVVLPALSPPTDADTGSPSSSPNAPADTIHDPGEADLLAKLQAAPSLSALSIAVSDAQADPRTGHLTLTFSLPPPAAAAGTLLRDTLLRAALQTAQATLSLADPQTQNLTLRCVASPEAGGSPSLLCVADITRAQASSVAGPGALTTEQLTALFSSPWFSSAVPT